MGFGGMLARVLHALWVSHLVLLNGIHLENQAVQVLGVLLRAQLDHPVVVDGGAVVFPRVLQQ